MGESGGPGVVTGDQTTRCSRWRRQCDGVANHQAHDRGHDCTDNDIPLPNVSSKILTKVVEYCKKHVHAVASNSSSKDTGGSEISDEDLKSWDSKFIKVDPTNLFD
ncbi:hypothetical protein ZIOFF_001638 [Zingiber officinale]|uniref:SKP1 component POZ domain-containing protein n=1 Tax=Zingiber officinale TaxID=94328 RepID=A0A8J5M7W5_ZINOF|nr:hypothetical protein ZIOFF_001638 [Zingiber officinale]